jgi:signal transduction histidine kinase
MRPRWLVVLGCLGLAAFCVLLWAIENTARPNLPMVVALMMGVVGLAVVPWARLAAVRLKGERDANRLLRQVTEVAIFVAIAGVVFTLVVFGKDSDIASAVVIISIFTAGALALLGAVVLPWIFLLTRTVTRERAARVRAEERAAMAAHLHDSVLQSLTLIHKRTEDPHVRRLARSTERELRAWLFGAPDTNKNDLVSAVTAAASEIEDRFAVTVELVLVGTCPLDARVGAVVGALREALTNAAKHSGVQRVSALVEVTGGEVFALVRDRGRGFDLSVHGGGDRRGVVDSIEGRMRVHGGVAAIRSEVGSGTEVELRMPAVT